MTSRLCVMWCMEPERDPVCNGAVDDEIHFLYTLHSGAPANVFHHYMLNLDIRKSYFKCSENLIVQLHKY